MHETVRHAEGRGGPGDGRFARDRRRHRRAPLRRRGARHRHRDDARGRRARSARRSRPGGGRGAVLDVASQASIDALIADIESREGPIGILCNNAGITRDMLLLRMKQEDWDAVIADQSRLGVPAVEGRSARHDEGTQGAHHQHRLGGRTHRQCGPGQLRGREGGHDRLQQVARPRGGLARDHGERGRARLHRYGHDARAQRGAARRAGCADPLGTPGTTPPTSPPRWHSWPPRRPRYITGETLHVNGGMHMA